MPQDRTTHARITTLIPTYHRAGLLRRAVLSVLRQNYAGSRVIVCDNASEDHTEEVVRRLRATDGRITYVRHASNIGSLANFRHAMSMVETEYFTILSDDDVLLPGFHRRAAEALAAHPEARMYCGQTVTFDETLGTHRLRPRREWCDGFHDAGAWADLMFREHFTWTGCVFAREVRDALGPIDPAPITDILYLVKAAALFPFIVDLRPCAVFSVTSAANSQQASVETLRLNLAASLAVCDELARRSDRFAGLARTVRGTFRFMGNRLLRQAFARGDRALAASAADFLRELGALSPRRRLLAAVARSGDAGAALVRRLGSIQALWRRRQRGGGSLTMTDVLDLYAGAEFRDAVVGAETDGHAAPARSDDAAVEAGRRLM